MSEKGIYGKYKIEKTDGSPVDPDAVYFVLRLDTDECARIAARKYADCVRGSNWTLGSELDMLVDKCTPKDTSAEEKVAEALSFVAIFGDTDGDHHKQWALDQLVRILAGTEDNYNEWVRLLMSGEDGPATFSWDIGIAP